MTQVTTHTAQFSLPASVDGVEYELFVEGSIRCIPAEYENGFLFYPATNEIHDTFKVLEVVRNGIPLIEFDQKFWDGVIDENELESKVQEFDPEFYNY